MPLQKEIRRTISGFVSSEIGSISKASSVTSTALLASLAFLGMAKKAEAAQLCFTPGCGTTGGCETEGCAADKDPCPNDCGGDCSCQSVETPRCSVEGGTCVPLLG